MKYSRREFLRSAVFFAGFAAMPLLFPSCASIPHKNTDSNSVYRKIEAEALRTTERGKTVRELLPFARIEIKTLPFNVGNTFSGSATGPNLDDVNIDLRDSDNVKVILDSPSSTGNESRALTSSRASSDRDEKDHYIYLPYSIELYEPDSDMWRHYLREGIPFMIVNRHHEIIHVLQKQSLYNSRNRVLQKIWNKSGDLNEIGKFMAENYKMLTSPQKVKEIQLLAESQSYYVANTISDPKEATSIDGIAETYIPLLREFQVGDFDDDQFYNALELMERFYCVLDKKPRSKADIEVSKCVGESVLTYDTAQRSYKGMEQAFRDPSPSELDIYRNRRLERELIEREAVRGIAERRLI